MEIIYSYSKSNLIKALLLICGVTTLLIACNSTDRHTKNSQYSVLGEFLHGKHLLRKFNVTTKESKQWHASYFLMGGSAGGGTYMETKVNFSWQSNTGEYVICSLPLHKIRVMIDSTVTTPYVRFNWDKSQNIYKYEWDVNYVIIYCREEDYPVNIQIDKL